MVRIAQIAAVVCLLGSSQLTVAQAPPNSMYGSVQGVLGSGPPVNGKKSASGYGSWVPNTVPAGRTVKAEEVKFYKSVTGGLQYVDSAKDLAPSDTKTPMYSGVACLLPPDTYTLVAEATFDDNSKKVFAGSSGFVVP
jgi:hypothetical protein